MVSHPADDYVREFTRNAPRDRILTVGAVASPEIVPINGVSVLASAKIGDAAALVLSCDGMSTPLLTMEKGGWRHRPPDDDCSALS